MQNYHTSCPIDPSFGQKVTDKNLIGFFAVHRSCLRVKNEKTDVLL